MIRVEVPKRVYEAFVRAWPTRAWAWSEIVPGRSYRVHYNAWEWKDALEAEKLLQRVREALRK